ncbi:MAG: hypothetical protein ABR571_17045 [Jatrophihabitans sp.]|uniref:hypothetical protein n=1 Tax=Jatrophihabitans sp. TaxID=1932789 RepID=UPI003911C8F8
MTLRTWLLPAIAAALIGGVLGVQVANGGGDFTPLRAADPCAARVVTSVASGIEGLGERLVLLGTDGAACRLGKSREALILELATPGPRPAAEIAALRAGLLGAVDRMKADGSLPKASELSDEVLADAPLPGLVKLLIRALPDGVINSALQTDDVLKRAIDKLDLRSVLAHLDDPDQLTRQINAAVTQAVKDALLDRLRQLVR